MSFQFRPDQIAALTAKLDSSNVRTREQSGKTLSYIEGWKAIDEANRIFGFDGWSRETLSVTHLATTERKIGKTNPRDGWSVGYMAKVRITVGTVVREGTGCGSGIDVDLVSAHESAVKEAETDAAKRALMTFGNPFGLALYDKTQENVEHKPDPQADERDTVEGCAWIRNQTDAAAIHRAWNEKLDWFLSLPKPMQDRLTAARDETLASLTSKPTASSVDAREAWVNKQIAALPRVISAQKLDAFLAANSGSIEALEEYQRKPFEVAVNDARRRLTGISHPHSGISSSVMLDDEIPF